MFSFIRYVWSSIVCRFTQGSTYDPLPQSPTEETNAGPTRRNRHRALTSQIAPPEGTTAGSTRRRLHRALHSHQAVPIERSNAGPSRRSRRRALASRQDVVPYNIQTEAEHSLQAPIETANGRPIAQALNQIRRADLIASILNSQARAIRDSLPPMSMDRTDNVPTLIGLDFQALETSDPYQPTQPEIDGPRSLLPLPVQAAYSDLITSIANAQASMSTEPPQQVLTSKPPETPKLLFEPDEESLDDTKEFTVRCPICDRTDPTGKKTCSFCQIKK